MNTLWLLPILLALLLPCLRQKQIESDYFIFRARKRIVEDGNGLFLLQSKTGFFGGWQDMNGGYKFDTLSLAKKDLEEFEERLAKRISSGQYRVIFEKKTFDKRQLQEKTEEEIESIMKECSTLLKQMDRRKTANANQ
jgi:hypothetical protein